MKLTKEVLEESIKYSRAERLKPDSIWAIMDFSIIWIEKNYEVWLDKENILKVGDWNNREEWVKTYDLELLDLESICKDINKIISK